MWAVVEQNLRLFGVRRGCSYRDVPWSLNTQSSRMELKSKLRLRLRRSAPSGAWLRLWHQRQRFPSRNRPCPLPSDGIVFDERKPATQLDGGRQFAIPVKDVTDGSSVFFGDNEHASKMGPSSK